MTKEEIYEKRSCAFCGWLTSALDWWCTNKKAAKLRGTTIPGTHHCPYWKPDKKYINQELYRPHKWNLYENGEFIEMFFSHKQAKKAKYFKTKEVYKNMLDLTYELKKVD